MVAPRKWHTEDIKAELRKRFGTLAGLSIKHGYHPSAFSDAIKSSRSTVIESAIAELLGKPAHVLWPDRYDASGNPLARNRAAATRNRRAAASAHRQIAEAA